MQTAYKSFAGHCSRKHLGTAVLLLILAGCASTPRGVSTTERYVVGASNAVEVVRHDVVPYLPSPYSGIVEGAGAVAVAVLGFWARHLHKQLAGHLATCPPAQATRLPTTPPTPPV